MREVTGRCWNSSARTSDRLPSNLANYDMCSKVQHIRLNECDGSDDDARCLGYGMTMFDSM
jgi:hypothetical protein